MMYKDLS